MIERPTIQITRPDTGEEEWESLREPLFSGWLTQGPKVAAFEEAFARHHGVDQAISASSCTTALHLALRALGVGPGDEVIVPSFTWVSTANVVMYCGATPVFADVERTTFNVDPVDVAARITERTKAIVPVHLFGLCADLDALQDRLRPDIHLIEDAACAAGGLYKDRWAGSIGKLGCFSFHPRKTITTGEGGMVTTNDATLADHIRVMRNHGASVSEESRHRGPQPHLLPDFDVLGFNYRMTDLQGAVGLVQLGKLERYIRERAAWAAYYREALTDLSWLRTPHEPTEGRHAWQAFVCYVDPEQAPLPRDEIMEQLHAQGIATRPGTHAIPALGYYREKFGLDINDFPGARDCAAHSMAIPLHNRMSRDDFERVIECLRSMFS